MVGGVRWKRRGGPLSGRGWGSWGWGWRRGWSGLCGFGGGVCAFSLRGEERGVVVLVLVVGWDGVGGGGGRNDFGENFRMK